MNLFNYLMTKKGHNTSVRDDLFVYLLGKRTPKEVKTASGTTISITDATREKIVSLTLSKESTQDGTPTPENPVEVKTVKGYRNLFDKDNVNWYRNNSSWNITQNVSDIRIRTNEFLIEGGKTYIISGYPSNVSLVAIRTFSELLGNNTNDVTRNGNIFTLGNDVKYIHLLFSGTNFTDETNVLMKNANIQIVKGTKELPYVPYGTNWIYTAVSNGTDTNYYTIPLNGNEIAGIGTYKDELIVDKNGHCWLNKKTGKVVLDGSESGWINGSTSNYSRFTLPLVNANSSSSRSICLSNYFKYISSGNTYSGCFISSRNVYLYPDIEINILEEWYLWLSTHNTEIYYPLETPQLIDLNYDVDVRLFNGVNNITNSDNMDMTLKYY